MAVVVMIACVILWAVIANYQYSSGTPIRSRGSLRYQRRKARKLGLSLDETPYETRAEPVSDYEETKAAVNRWARWLWIPTILLWAALLLPELFDRANFKLTHYP